MRAQSTIITELLILAITLSLALSFIIAANSYFSYYAQIKKFASIYVFSTSNDNWVNFTAIHSGGDAIDIFGQIIAISPNGTLHQLNAYIIRGEEEFLIDGSFKLSMFKFGEMFKVCVNLNGINIAKIQLTINTQDYVIAKVVEEV